MLRDRQYATRLSRNRDAVDTVHVKHAVGVLARGVDGAVNRESGRVDLVGTIHHLPPVEIHLDQGRRGYLAEQHTVWIDQEVMSWSGHACRNVCEDQVIPAEKRDQPVTSSKINSLLPFGLADDRSDGRS